MIPFRHIWLTCVVVIAMTAGASFSNGQQQERSLPAVNNSAADKNKAVALALLLNAYQEDQLLLSLIAASPFSAERAAIDLAATLKDISIEKRTQLKRDWFIFLMNRFTILEINQMRQWQLQSPQSQALVLKIVAQVAASDPEILGQLMGIVPQRISR